ncbi:LysR substrate-binding domain-containing protein [Verticiella alkaliphila]|uniref:LysR substrate-binding domain-containing protein n=1 Tax=Verticiella alkaliphila TaxID=2779529 RepID=UPI0035300327
MLAATALPEAIHQYAARLPKVVVRVCDVAVERLVDSVASGDVDIAVGPDRATGRDVRSQTLFHSPWVLWCAPTHTLATRRSLRWAELHDEPLVAAGRDHEISVERMRLNVPEHERVAPVDIVDNISTALGIAAQGRSATLAPAYVRTLAETFGLRMQRVVDPETVRDVCLYRPEGRSLSPAAEGFAQFLETALKAWARRLGRPTARPARM